MAAILLVRRSADIPTAIQAVNHILHLRYSCIQRDPHEDVVAILVRAQLEAGLPFWPTLAGTRPGSGELGIRESVSLCGVWSLCWLYGQPLLGEGSATERRASTLRLLGHALPPVAWEASFPVLGAEELRACLDSGWRHTSAGERGIPAEGCYGQDHQRGIFALTIGEFPPCPDLWL